MSLFSENFEISQIAHLKKYKKPNLAIVRSCGFVFRYDQNSVQVGHNRTLSLTSHCTLGLERLRCISRWLLVSLCCVLCSFFARPPSKIIAAAVIALMRASSHWIFSCLPTPPMRHAPPTSCATATAAVIVCKSQCQILG